MELQNASPILSGLTIAAHAVLDKATIEQACSSSTPIKRASITHHITLEAVLKIEEVQQLAPRPVSAVKETEDMIVTKK